jgi:3-oxoacyl-[acyl-carrier protein] reductase
LDLGLRDKYALITGGSHGIGLATAKALAAEGCHIAICSRTQARLDGAIGELKEYGVKTEAFAADVLRSGDIDHVMDVIERIWGTLHILVNNVGGGGRWGEENVEATDPRVWTEVFDKNAMAAVRFTRRAIPLMRKNRWGRVVTVTSMHGREGGGRPWYNMAKGAETNLMKTLALTRYLVRDGITFNSVAPGAIYIAGTGFEDERRRDPQAFERAIDEHYPLGRMGTPEEVAAVITFICSQQAALVNGANVAVDGGQTRSL